MRLLALETSTLLGSCALWLNGQCIERFCPDGRSHSETLLPLLRSLLAEADVSLNQLDAIAFGAGPGAFTGLRVACGVAQGLAVGAGLPVIPVGSLEALAWSVDAPCVLALLDARMGEVYSGIFQRAGQDLSAVGDIRLSPPEKVVWPEKAVAVAVGNALAAYPLLAEKAHALGMQMKPEALPQAGAVATLAALRLAAGASCDPAVVAPLYVRDKVARTIAERLSEGGKA